MNILIACFLLSLVQLTIHFWLTNNIKSFNLPRLNNYFFSFQQGTIEGNTAEYEEKIITHTLTKNTEDNTHILLKKSIKHLEFISEFEMYLEEKNYKKFPLEILQDFEKLKTDAQLSILKTAKQLSHSIDNLA